MSSTQSVFEITKLFIETCTTRFVEAMGMGGFHKDKKGYPRWNDSNRLVHRDVARNMSGGHLSRGTVVHHIDGNKGNFRASNLRPMSRSEHSSLHNRRRQRY